MKMINVDEVAKTMESLKRLGNTALMTNVENGPIDGDYVTIAMVWKGVTALMDSYTALVTEMNVIAEIACENEAMMKRMLNDQVANQRRLESKILELKQATKSCEETEA